MKKIILSFLLHGFFIYAQEDINPYNAEQRFDIVKNILDNEPHLKCDSYTKNINLINLIKNDQNYVIQQVQKSDHYLIDFLVQARYATSWGIALPVPSPEGIISVENINKSFSIKHMSKDKTKTRYLNVKLLGLPTANKKVMFDGQEGPAGFFYQHDVDHGRVNGLYRYEGITEEKYQNSIKLLYNMQSYSGLYNNENLNAFKLAYFIFFHENLFDIHGIKNKNNFFRAYNRVYTYNTKKLKGFLEKSDTNISLERMKDYLDIAEDVGIKINGNSDEEKLISFYKYYILGLEKLKEAYENTMDKKELNK
jgi:hypothetical protein